MTDAKVAVGRRLFYDVRLSGNGTQSCAVVPPAGAGVHGRQGAGRRLDRPDAPARRAVADQRRLQLDADLANPALVSLERQMEVPLFGSRPGRDGRHRRQQGPGAPPASRRTPGTGRASRRPSRARRADHWTTIDPLDRLLPARPRLRGLALRPLFRGKAELTAAEKRGMELFMGEHAECHHCHGSFIFNDQVTYEGSPTVKPLFHNTGLYDLGRDRRVPRAQPRRLRAHRRGQGHGCVQSAVAAQRRRHRALHARRLGADAGSRGRALRGRGPPHHRRSAGRRRAREPVQGPADRPDRADPGDKADLVAFLKTLTDRRVLTDKRFSDPFKR